MVTETDLFEFTDLTPDRHLVTKNFTTLGCDVIQNPFYDFHVTVFYIVCCMRLLSCILFERRKGTVRSAGIVLYYKLAATETPVVRRNFIAKCAVYDW
jgi:hypothetical protein